MEILQGLPVLEVGGWGIFVIQSLALIQALRKGALVPKSTVDAMRHDFEAHIAYAEKAFETRIGEAIDRENDSKETAKIMLQGNTELLRQNGLLAGELKIVGKTMAAINPALSEADHDD